VSGRHRTTSKINKTVPSALHNTATGLFLFFFLSMTEFLSSSFSLSFFISVTFLFSSHPQQDNAPRYNSCRSYSGHPCSYREGTSPAAVPAVRFCLGFSCILFSFIQVDLA